MLRRARFPRPRLPLELRVGDEDVMKIDFAWPMHRIALHVDGFGWHARRQTFDTDARQRTRLAALGWVTLTATSRSLEHGWLNDLEHLLRERLPQRQLRL
jgi:very-short-patch-repair endonuclease